MEQYKTCTSCKQSKSQSDFKLYKNKCHNCHKQYHRDYQQKYRKVNKDKELARSRELYQINRSKILDRKRKNYQKHREKNIQRKLAWQKANPVLCRLSSQRRRAMISQNGVFEIAPRDARRLSNEPCFYCNQRTESMTFDHIIPIAKGGRHSFGNLVSACKPCNSSKNDKLLTQWRKVTVR